MKRRLRVSKKSTLSWTGMPFARKSEIFGLYSIPANTTPASLKNRLFSAFSLTRCFFAAHVAEKTKCGVNTATLPNLQFIDRLKSAIERLHSFFMFLNLINHSDLISEVQWGHFTASICISLLQ